MKKSMILKIPSKILILDSSQKNSKQTLSNIFFFYLYLYNIFFFLSLSLSPSFVMENITNFIWFEQKKILFLNKSYYFAKKNLVFFLTQVQNFLNPQEYFGVPYFMNGLLVTKIPHCFDFVLDISFLSFFFIFLYFLIIFFIFWY